MSLRLSWLMVTLCLYALSSLPSLWSLFTSSTSSVWLVVSVWPVCLVRLACGYYLPRLSRFLCAFTFQLACNCRVPVCLISLVWLVVAVVAVYLVCFVCLAYSHSLPHLLHFLCASASQLACGCCVPMCLVSLVWLVVAVVCLDSFFVSGSNTELYKPNG